MKNNVSDIAKEVARVVESADEYAEMIRALLEISKGLHGKMPIKEVTDELRFIFGQELRPIWEMLNEATAKIQTDGVMFRAKLIRRVMEEHGLSEEAAIKLVLNEQRAFLTAMQSRSDKKKDDGNGNS